MGRNVLNPLEGLDLETRDLADAAARKAGLSLDEWVANVIMERMERSSPKQKRRSPHEDLEAIISRMAKATHRRPGSDFETIISAAAQESDRHEADQIARTAVALDSMASWIERAETRLDQVSRHSADYQDRLSSTLSDALASLKDRLDDVERKVDTERGPTRIGFPIQEAVRALSPLSDTLTGLRSDVTRLAERFEQPLNLNLSPAIEDIKDEIEHLQATVGTLATRQEIAGIDRLVRDVAANLTEDRNRDDIAALTKSVGALQHQIQDVLSGNADAVYRKVSTQIDLLKQRIQRVAETGIDRSVIDFLSSQIVDMRQDLAQRAEPQQIEQLSSDVATLGRQVADIRLNQVGKSDFAALKHSLEDICHVLNRTAAAQAKSDVPDRLLKLTEQVSRLVERPEPTGPDLGPVAKQLALLTDRMSALNEGRTRHENALEGLIGRLSEQMQDAVENPAAGHGPLIERFERLEDGLRQVGQQADISAMKQMLRAISERLEQQAEPSLEGFEQRIATLTERLAHSHPASSPNAEAQIKILQDEASQIAERAAKAALNHLHADAPSGSDFDALKQGFVELKALHVRSDKKTQQTLQAVHDALETLIGRFGEAPAAVPAPSQDVQADRLEAAVKRLHAAALSQVEEVAASVPEPVKPENPVVDEPAPEPLRTMSAATFASDATDASELRSSFIAAARRAAQQTPPEKPLLAQEANAQTLTAQDDIEPQGNLIERLKKTLDTHKRPVTFSLAFLVIALGALHTASTMGTPAIAPVQITSAAPKAAAQPFNPLAAPEDPAEAQLFQPVALTVATSKFFVEPSSLGELPSGLPDVLHQAALKGDGSAIYEIASRAAEGRGMERNPALAGRLFERAAQAGMAPAQERLAMFHEKGFGVARDQKLSLTWYERAAMGGNTRAMHNLATLLASGAGGKTDYAAALRWYQEAAEAGVRDSQFNIGVLYARAVGTRPDLGQAYKWFALAALQGDQEAARKRDEVAAKLKPDELATAKGIVERWRPRAIDISANEVAVLDESKPASFQVSSSDKI